MLTLLSVTSNVSGITNHQTFMYGCIRVGSNPLNIFVPKDRFYSVTSKVFHNFFEFFGTFFPKKPLTADIISFFRDNSLKIKFYNVGFQNPNFPAALCFPHILFVLHNHLACIGFT